MELVMTLMLAAIFLASVSHFIQQTLKLSHRSEQLGAILKQRLCADQLLSTWIEGVKVYILKPEQEYFMQETTSANFQGEAPIEALPTLFTVNVPKSWRDLSPCYSHNAPAAQPVGFKTPLCESTYLILHTYGPTTYTPYFNGLVRAAIFHDPLNKQLKLQISPSEYFWPVEICSQYGRESVLLEGVERVRYEFLSLSGGDFEQTSGSSTPGENESRERRSSDQPLEERCDRWSASDRRLPTMVRLYLQTDSGAIDWVYTLNAAATVHLIEDRESPCTY